MTLQAIYPVRQLLDQWLLLPLFADLALMALVLRSVRNRAGFTLAALLGLLALDVVAETWPEAPAMPGLYLACRAFLPALVTLYILSYAGGRRLAGSRGLWTTILIAPSAIFAGTAIYTGMPASSPALPGFSMSYFGAAIAYLFLSGAAKTFSDDETVLFMAALTSLIASGPGYGLARPLLGVELPLFPYFSAAAGALLARASLRYKAFSVTPPSGRRDTGAAVPPAGLFMARTGESLLARSVFTRAVRSGAPGLAFSRTHPVAFRRQAGLAAVPVIWLANSSFEKALPPASVEVLSHTVRDMGEQADRCVVLVEDLDYLVTNAGLFPTLEMLEEVRLQAERAAMTVLLSSELLTDEERRDLRAIGVRLLPRVAGAPAMA